MKTPTWYQYKNGLYDNKYKNAIDSIILWHKFKSENAQAVNCDCSFSIISNRKIINNEKR